MDIIIASNDARMAKQVANCLAELESGNSPIQVLSHSAARDVALKSVCSSPTVILFCSQHFASEEIEVLKQIGSNRSNLVKVAAVGPLRSPELMLQAIHAGAVDYLDIQGNLRNSLADLLKRVAAGQRAAAQPGKLITILGATGGAGASLLACNIAATLASRAKSCALLDFHVRGGDLAKLLNAAPRYTLGSLADKADQLDATMFQQALVEHECGIRLLAGPEPFVDFRRLAADFSAKLLDFAQAAFPYVIVDLGEANEPQHTPTLAVSDRIVIPLRPDYVSLYHAKKCLEYLARARVARDRILIVINRKGQPRELPLSTLSEFLGMRVTHCVPDNLAAVNTSYNLGIPLVISRPRGRISRSIANLVDDLTGEAPQTARASRWLATLRAPGQWFTTSRTTHAIAETTAAQLKP